MKKTLCTLVIAGTILTSCQNTTKKEQAAQDNVENAKENLNTAKEELSDARKEASEEEWDTFRADTDATITANEARITDLKASMNNTGKTIDVAYANRIAALEQKNKDIKSKIENYKNDSKEDWNSFKQEYDRDIDELGKAFKNLTVDNK